MALVAHKYMPQEMSDEELRATFAAREHTLDYLVESFRRQCDAKTFTSYLITGPRGSGKTTLVLMLCLRIREDERLARAWLPVRFPEELPGITSLRDLLAETLHVMAEDGVPGAAEWHERVAAEMDDELSRELAIDGLREIARREGRRLVLFVENLDLVFDRGLDERSQRTLRRLLMDAPFMMVVGTAVKMFEALRVYDEAFFNYFCPVPLERLDDDQVGAVLFRRAEYDGNREFPAQYERHKGRIKAISRLTGGNPRMVLMLYEAIAHGNLASTVDTLRALVDELTPLLKDVLEHQFSDQQSKILDALMRSGGTATPSQIARAARLSLNTVTTQLPRLKSMQVVELRGGGKGRAAYYTVPDQLFLTWYQMRYLRKHRRRIELFVEVLRVWFEEEEQSARAPFHPGVTMGLQEDTDGAIADGLLAATSPEVDSEVRQRALAVTLLTACEADDSSLARVSRPVSEALADLDSAERALEIEALLRQLASPAMKSHWPRVWRCFAEAQPPEVAERLEFFRPVAEILETGDRSRLDPLPPHERPFVEEVLAKFEAGKDEEGAIAEIVEPNNGVDLKRTTGFERR